MPLEVRGCGALEVGVTLVAVKARHGLRTYLGPLREQRTLLTAEPSLQPRPVSLIPALRRQKKVGLCEFKVSLVYLVEFRLAKSTQ